MREEEEKEAERKRWKQKKRHRDHHVKLAKQIRNNHWSVRYIDEERRNQILKVARGEGEGQSNGVEKQETVRRPNEEREKEGSLATMRTGDTRRNSSMVDSTSVWMVPLRPVHPGTVDRTSTPGGVFTPMMWREMKEELT